METIYLDPLERRLLEVAREIAAQGLSPNNQRLYNRVRGPDCPSYQALKRIRARLADLGLLPAPAVLPEAARVLEAAGFRVELEEVNRVDC